VLDAPAGSPYGAAWTSAAAAAALALPRVTQAGHHGRRSFRVGAGKVIATVWSEDQLNVMVGEELAHASAAQAGVELLWWGKQLSGVRGRPRRRRPGPARSWPAAGRTARDTCL